MQEGGGARSGLAGETPLSPLLVNGRKRVKGGRVGGENWMVTVYARLEFKGNYGGGGPRGRKRARVKFGPAPFYK